MFERLLDVHIEHFGDVPSLEADLQRLLREPPTLADRTRHPDVRQKIHLQLVRAVAFAGFATTAGDVKAEPARFEAPQLRIRELRVKIANQVKQLDVRRGIRPRRPPDGRLVDVDRLIDVL